jgi:hypothetical protein
MEKQQAGRADQSPGRYQAGERVAWRFLLTGPVSGSPQSEIAYHYKKRRPAENLTRVGQE